MNSTHFNQEFVISVDGDTCLKDIRYNALFIRANSLRGLGYYVHGGYDLIKMESYYINNATFAMEY